MPQARFPGHENGPGPMPGFVRLSSSKAALLRLRPACQDRQVGRDASRVLRAGPCCGLSMGLVPVFILAGPDMYGRLLLAPAGPGIRILLGPYGAVAQPDLIGQARRVLPGCRLEGPSP